MTTRSSITKLIALIPKDELRPHANFGGTLTMRMDEFTRQDVSALESLTSNRHRDHVWPLPCLLPSVISGERQKAPPSILSRMPWEEEMMVRNDGTDLDSMR